MATSGTPDTPSQSRSLDALGGKPGEIGGDRKGMIRSSDSASSKGSESTRQDWRELAQQIQSESDPQKMIALVQQLIAQFDKESSRRG